MIEPGTTGISLPALAITDDGSVITTEVAEPCWLYAWRTTNLETGLSWFSVYRSVESRDEDPAWKRVSELINGADLLGSETVIDPDMMHGQAELSIYG